MLASRVLSPRAVLGKRVALALARRQRFRIQPEEPPHTESHPRLCSVTRHLAGARRQRGRILPEAIPANKARAPSLGSRLSRSVSYAASENYARRTRPSRVSRTCELPLRVSLFVADRSHRGFRATTRRMPRRRSPDLCGQLKSGLESRVDDRDRQIHGRSRRRPFPASGGRR